MKVSHIVKRYIAILGRLSNNKKATFKQIQEAIERESDGNKPIEIRTFQRMVKDIYELFRVQIKCNRDGFYFIVRDETDFQSSKVTQSLHFLNYQKHLENFEKNISFDKSCVKGHEYIFDIQSAIKDKVFVEFIYKKFVDESEEIDSRLVMPYGLKEDKGRWYLVGRDEDANEMRTFGLDRIEQLNLSNRRGQIPEEFDIHKHFEFSVGVEADTKKIPEVITLRFTNRLSGYIKTFPIHENQTVEEENESSIIVKFRAYINTELVNELMRYSDDVQVIKPALLKKKLLQRSEDIMRNNGDNKLN